MCVCVFLVVFFSVPTIYDKPVVCFFLFLGMVNRLPMDPSSARRP